MEHREDSSGQPRPVRILLQPRVLSPDQKRRAERTSTQRIVAAEVVGAGEKTEVPLVNVSPTGLQLCVGGPVAPGTALDVEALPGKVLRATVRWSREEEGDYQVGAEWESPLTPDEVWKIRSET